MMITSGRTQAFSRLGALIVCAALLTACGFLQRKAELQAPNWALQKTRVLTGFHRPECVLVAPHDASIYISNIVLEDEAYWDDDGEGYISQYLFDGSLRKHRWLDSQPDAPLNGPKGMGILNGWLYIADNTRLMRYPLDGSRPLEAVEMPNCERLNDVATDGQAIWVSDIGASKIYRVDPKGGWREIPSPPTPNGLTFGEGKMFAASWDQHDIYEVDPMGENDPIPFGLGDHFQSADGLEVLDDGSIIVTDFLGGTVNVVSPDRKSVKVLTEMITPADIGLDRRKRLLYVPSLKEDKVTIYALLQE